MTEALSLGALVKITQDDVVDRQTTLHVELEPEDVDKYLDRAYKRVVQRTNVPGFRKGKAPRAVLENYVGREALLEEALEFMLPDCTASAIEQQELIASGTPDVELVQMEPAIQFKATVPLEPLVDLGNYREIRLETEPVEVTDEQVAEVVEGLRREAAMWEPVDRPVALQDMLTITATGKVEEEVVLEEKDGVFIPEESDRPFPGFSLQLVGIARGETKEFTLSIPEDFRDTRLAGKECHFSVQVMEIKERILPELDDEFAKGVGEGFESLEALCKKLGEDLRQGAESEARNRYHEEILETILRGASISLPPMLVEHEIEHLVEQREQALQNERVSMDEYLLRAGKTTEELREEMRQEAITRMNRSFLLVELAKTEGIEVSDPEIEDRIKAMTSGSTPSERELGRFFNSEEGRSSVRSMLRNSKVFEELESIAKGEAPQREPAESQEESNSEEQRQEEQTAGGT